MIHKTVRLVTIFCSFCGIFFALAAGNLSAAIWATAACVAAIANHIANAHIQDLRLVIKGLQKDP